MSAQQITVFAEASSCSSIDVFWSIISGSHSVSVDRRDDNAAASHNVLSKRSIASPWRDTSVRCKHKYVYTVSLWNNGQVIGQGQSDSRGVSVSVCCSTRSSTYLIALGHDISESKFGSFALLSPQTNSIFEYIHEPGEITKDLWRLIHTLMLPPNEAIQDTALSLIQSSSGNLEAVVHASSPDGGVADMLLGFEFIEDTGWSGPFVLKSDQGPIPVAGSQALIQSDNDNLGKFELLVPVTETAITHYRLLSHTIMGGTWMVVATLPALDDEQIRIGGVSLIQSSPGNLAAIARVSLPPDGGIDTLFGYVFSEDTGWSNPFALKSDQGPIGNVAGSQAFIHSSESTFDLLVPIGAFIHHYRLENMPIPEGTWRLVAKLPPLNNDDQTRAISLSLTQNTLGDLELVARERLPQGQGKDVMVGYVFREDTGWTAPSVLESDQGPITAEDSSAGHDDNHDDHNDKA